MKVKVVVRVANSAAVHAPGRAKEVTRRALTKPGVHGIPDIVLLQEVAPVDVRELGRLTGHDVIQYGPIGSPQAGVAIAVRHPIGQRRGRPQLVVGSRRTREGGGIRMRPLISEVITVRGSRVLRYASGHADPPRAPLANKEFMKAVRRQWGVVGGDFNHRIVGLRRILTRKVRGKGALALVVPPWVTCSKATGVEIGSDHLAVDVVLYLPRGRAKK